MEAVKSFNSELAGLYECKPPISKAKMTAITKGAIRAIKFYKHVVQSVEKFIQKCKTEYKIPGLYVIDSIVRQSRHQFGIEKDVFAPRFAKNIRVTFFYLFKCPQEDKSKVIRVLNLWQKNQVFVEDIIQPLFDLADPNSSIQKDVSNLIAQKASKAKAQQHHSQESQLQSPPSGGGGGGNSIRRETAVSLSQQVDDESNLVPLVNQQPVPVTSVSSQVMTAAVTNLDPTLIQQIQQILMKQPPQDDGSGMAAAAAAAAAAGIGPPMPEEVKTQVIPGITPSGDYDGRSLPFLPVDTSQPPPGYMPQGPFMGGMPPAPMAVPPPTLDYPNVHMPPEKPKSPLEDGEHSEDSDDIKEVIHEDRDMNRHRSRSRSRSRSRRKRRASRSRSRSRSKSRHRRSRSRSRGRRSSSRSRRRRSRSRERDRDRDRDRRDRDRDRDHKDRKKDREKEKLDPEKERAREKEREKEEERRKRGLPPIKSDYLSVCSTTLWVGHMSKLVHQEELSDTFGEYGDIVSIDLIPPRGCAFICMNRRQDAARALSKLKSHKMHNKAITMAWAPGKGVKGKEFKDYWEVEVGCSYIPYHKLITMSSFDLDNLEEGGMIDEETVPDWLRGRYGLEAAPATGPPPGFVPIGVPQGPPPSNRGQDVGGGMPPLPPSVGGDKSQDRDNSGPGMPPNRQGLPPNMLPPPFGLPNMPPPQVGPGGPGGMPPLPQGLMPPNLPPLGVPPPMGLPPLGVHPPVSSILGQPLIGAMPPSVSMANRAMMPPGSNMQNNMNSAPPVTTMANNASMINSNSQDSNDMDIEMEDVDKNLHGKENGLSSKDDKDGRRERVSRFERPGPRSPSEKMMDLDRLKSMTQGGDMGSRDRFDRDRGHRDSRERERDRDRDREDSRGRDRFGPDSFSGPPPGFPQVRPNGPPNFRPDGPSGPNGRVGPGGFGSFVPVPGFGPPGSGGGTGGPPARLLGGPPPGHGPSSLRGEAFGPVGLGMLSGSNGPGFGPRGMHGPGGFNGPRGLLGPPPLNLGSLLGGRPPLIGDIGGRPNGPGGLAGPRPGIWMEGPRFPGHDPQGLRDGMSERPPWDSDRPRDGDRPSDMDRFRDDRGRGDDRPRDDRERSREDHFRDDISRDERSRDDRSRDDRDRSRDDRLRDDRSRDSRSRDDRSRDDRFRDDRSREDRFREERYREDRGRDDRGRGDRFRDDRSRDGRPRDDRYQDDRSRDMDRPWDNRYRDERPRDFERRDEKRPWEKSRWGPQVEDENTMEVEEAEPDSWDIWAKMSSGNAGENPMIPGRGFEGPGANKENAGDKKNLKNEAGKVEPNLMKGGKDEPIVIEDTKDEKDEPIVIKDDKVDVIEKKELAEGISDDAGKQESNHESVAAKTVGETSEMDTNVDSENKESFKDLKPDESMAKEETEQNTAQDREGKTSLDSEPPMESSTSKTGNLELEENKQFLEGNKAFGEVSKLDVAQVETEPVTAELCLAENPETTSGKGDQDGPSSFTDTQDSPSKVMEPSPETKRVVPKAIDMFEDDDISALQPMLEEPPSDLKQVRDELKSPVPQDMFDFEDKREERSIDASAMDDSSCAELMPPPVVAAVSQDSSFQEGNDQDSDGPDDHLEISSPGADELSLEASMNITSQEDQLSPDREIVRDGDGEANEGFDEAVDQPTEASDAQDDNTGDQINED